MENLEMDPRIREAQMEEKRRALREHEATQNARPAGAVQGGGVRMLTLAEVARNQADFHGGAADKAARLARFLEANPAFEEFINLIRMGAITL